MKIPTNDAFRPARPAPNLALTRLGMMPISPWLQFLNLSARIVNNIRYRQERFEIRALKEPIEGFWPDTKTHRYLCEF